MAALQRRTALRLCRVYPRATRVASSNFDPLPMWRTGAQLVCLNMQTNDLPTQVMESSAHTSPHLCITSPTPTLLNTLSSRPLLTPLHGSWPARLIASSTTSLSPSHFLPLLVCLALLSPALLLTLKPPAPPTRQLHYALFERGGHSGYVLKPAELRELPDLTPVSQTSLMLKLRAGRAFRLAMGGMVEPTLQEQHAAAAAMQALYRGRKERERKPSAGFSIFRFRSTTGAASSAFAASSAAIGGRRNTTAVAAPRPGKWTDEEAPQVKVPAFWPPTRKRVRRVSLRILALYHLPTRRESRPKLVGGQHAPALAFTPQLNGERAPPEAGAAPMSPSIQLSLHAIGGFACISPYNPPPEGSGTTYATPPANSNGLNPSYNRLVHCMAGTRARTRI